MERELLLDQILTYKARIAELEQENKALEGTFFQLTDYFNETIENIPYPLFILSKKGGITFANQRFIDLLSFEARERFASRHDQTFLLKEVVSEKFQGYFEPFLLRGKTATAEEIEIKGINYLLSIKPICKEESAIVMLKNLSDNTILREEIVARIENLIDQNMSMVQEIGFLLGEDTSKRIRMLHSVIELLHNR